MRRARVNELAKGTSRRPFCRLNQSDADRDVAVAVGHQRGSRKKSPRAQMKVPKSTMKGKKKLLEADRKSSNLGRFVRQKGGRLLKSRVQGPASQRQGGKAIEEQVFN